MRFGIFYEHQLPRPWGPEDERILLENALEQIEIADRVGFDYVWAVEHHFLEEYSHSSAPEVFLAAASQRTKRIRLGHGIVQLPPTVNHPARVAERIATLDLLSGGRVDFGTGESSSAAELGGFLVDRNAKRAQWEDALDVITRMFVEEPFAGWDSRSFQMPPRNVVPKPLQRPHPPLWVACSRRETIHLAAKKGIGALSFSFVEPEDAAKWVKEYFELLASTECVPAGFAVNPNFTVVLPMMCHRTESTAIARGIDGAHFFGYSLAHYYGMRPHFPGRTNVWDEFQARRETTGFARELVQADKAPLGVKILQHGVGSLRGAIGTPAQISELLRRYEQAGVDQVCFVLQAGRNRHEDICASLELFGKEVIPRFADRIEAKDLAKRERLAKPIDDALARRAPLRSPPQYKIDEPAELARARRSRARPPLRGWLSRSAGDMKADVRHGAQRALASLIRDRSDEQIERAFGSSIVQAVIFRAMASAYDPSMAFGFNGDIVYELAKRIDGAALDTPARWRLRVDGTRVTASRDDSATPAVRVRIGLVDFARIIGGELNPALPMMEGRIGVEGDLGVALRLIEMFGGPSPY